MMAFRTLSEVIAAAQAIWWQSRLRSRSLWGFPVPRFVGMAGISGRRWTLTETAGGCCWVAHDQLIEIRFGRNSNVGRKIAHENRIGRAIASPREGDPKGK